MDTLEATVSPPDGYIIAHSFLNNYCACLSPQQHPVEPQAVIEANRASVSLHHIQALPPAKVFDGHGSKLDRQMQLAYYQVTEPINWLIHSQADWE